MDGEEGVQFDSRFYVPAWEGHTYLCNTTENYIIMITTNDILETTEPLSEEQREVVLNLLHRRPVETRRE